MARPLGWPCAAEVILRAIYIRRGRASGDTCILWAGVRTAGACLPLGRTGRWGPPDPAPAPPHPASPGDSITAGAWSPVQQVSCGPCLRLASSAVSPVPPWLSEGASVMPSGTREGRRFSSKQLTRVRVVPAVPGRAGGRTDTEDWSPRRRQGLSVQVRQVGLSPSLCL